MVVMGTLESTTLDESIKYTSRWFILSKRNAKSRIRQFQV